MRLFKCTSCWESSAGSRGGRVPSGISVMESEVSDFRITTLLKSSSWLLSSQAALLCRDSSGAWRAENTLSGVLKVESQLEASLAEGHGMGQHQ
jgi:hypothetical protein